DLRAEARALHGLQRAVGVCRLDQEVEVVLRGRAATDPGGDPAGDEVRDLCVAQRGGNLLQGRNHPVQRVAGGGHETWGTPGGRACNGAGSGTIRGCRTDDRSGSPPPATCTPPRQSATECSAPSRPSSAARTSSCSPAT